MRHVCAPCPGPGRTSAALVGVAGAEPLSTSCTLCVDGACSHGNCLPALLMQQQSQLGSRAHCTWASRLLQLVPPPYADKQLSASRTSLRAGSSCSLWWAQVVKELPSWGVAAHSAATEVPNSSPGRSLAGPSSLMAAGSCAHMCSWLV